MSQPSETRTIVIGPPLVRIGVTVRTKVSAKYYARVLRNLRDRLDGMTVNDDTNETYEVTFTSPLLPPGMQTTVEASGNRLVPVMVETMESIRGFNGEKTSNGKSVDVVTPENRP